ncbi:N-alpha-acetyltransferase mak3 [Steccherinum ochraceum]|uniref:N-alpha-acetyltransferase mak3 n=1 Tax=Steccherinum ochraceum TaxID=92696 RepID=A0A4R0RKI0_9APHY|nr:N-alpha-acetyltransferase mak3 [Steccherinum ochraceum]
MSAQPLHENFEALHLQAGPSSSSASSTPTPKQNNARETSIQYRLYTGEEDLPDIMTLVQSELSEPYAASILPRERPSSPSITLPTHVNLGLRIRREKAFAPDEPAHPVGVIICKQSVHKSQRDRGYIAMLSVKRDWRKRGIATTLVRKAIDAMVQNGAEEVVLETEYDNSAALSLYESLGFIREKRLYRFYLNGKDAFRLVLVLPPSKAGGDGR